MIDKGGVGSEGGDITDELGEEDPVLFGVDGDLKDVLDEDLLL